MQVPLAMTTYFDKLVIPIDFMWQRSIEQIRKYRIAIGKPIGKGIPNIDKINGVVDGMLHPICLEIKKLLSEGSKFLISMIDMNRFVNNVKN